MQKVLILDFGSQYTQLIARRIREQSVFSAVLARERSKYIALARTSGYTICGYYFQSRLQDSLQRNQQRSGRAVIPEKGVLAKYHAIQRPRYSEGFDQLYYVSIDLHSGFIVREWLEDHESPAA